ncbi:MAG: hypothetical protein HC908_14825 [Calothrix sp. SM1_7_51]|nr:hypothetical protein [Calothrix sp. SM1_7_51]
MLVWGLFLAPSLALAQSFPQIWSVTRPLNLSQSECIRQANLALRAQRWRATWSDSNVTNGEANNYGAQILCRAVDRTVTFVVAGPNRGRAQSLAENLIRANNSWEGGSAVLPQPPNTNFDEQFYVINNPDVASQYYPELIFKKWVFLNINQFPQIKYLKRILKLFNLNRFYLAAWCWKNNLRFLVKIILTKQQLNDLLEYSSADLIVSTGGTYLVENYSLEARIFDYRVSLLLGKPLVFFTQSLGPFSIPKNQRVLKKIFEESLLILLRDQKSENNILKLGTQNANTFISADAAFALADTSALEIAQSSKNLLSKPKIAISVRDWKHFKTIDPVLGRQKYLEAVGNMTIHLVEKYKAEITYISTCQGIPEYWTDDSKVAFEIIEKLPITIANSVTLKSKIFHSPKELAKIIQSYDLVVSTRLHMAILSLGVGTPVMPIAYEFKTQELFKRLGQKPDLVLDIEEIDSESLISSIDLFITSISKISSTLFSNVKNEQKRALESGDIVKKTFRQDAV